MNDRKDRRGLGRGLSALMADVAPAHGDDQIAGPRQSDQVLPIEALVPNPDQPRRHFSTEALEELAASIRAKGVIQPLVVRPDPNQPTKYQIVAGERRWRAAQMAQCHELPVRIRDFTDSEVLEIAIIENIQRADLNAVEEAQGYRQLMDRFGHTQERLAEALGKSRSHIANLLRLLNLPQSVQSLLRNGELTAGHARALITTDDPDGLARQIVAKGLSVREVEELTRKARTSTSPKTRHPVEKDADTRVLEHDLSASLGMSVVIDHRPESGGGIVTIRYKTLDDLDQLCQVLSSVR